MPNFRSTIIALIAVMVTVGALWWTHRTVAPREATWADVVAEARDGGYRLIATAELADALRQGRDAPLLVDTRQEWEYRTGHFTGALNFPIEPTAWSRWRKAGALAALLGPDKERRIVFY
jgi:hypothetical protein